MKAVCDNKNRMKINKGTVEYAISEKKVLTITSRSYFGRERDFIDSVLDHYLRETGMAILFANISYCIHELGGNAHKANMKRLFFEHHNWDIGDPRQYTSGMELFKKELQARRSFYGRLHRTNGYFIKFQFQLREPYFHILIRNNVGLTSQEKEKIRDKLALARYASNLTDVYTASEDYAEGAGLGLVMLHIILKNLGFESSFFRISSDGTETKASLSLDMRCAALAEKRYREAILAR